jgi:transcriptional antiterminator RfaH
LQQILRRLAFVVLTRWRFCRVKTRQESVLFDVDNQRCLGRIVSFMNLRDSEAQLDELSWYCARTQPKHEHIAASNLVKRLGLEVFHPRLRLERPTRRGLVRVVEPLFPCYIFLRCRLDTCLDGIRHTTGISSLVHFGQRMPAVPDGVIEELRQCFGLEEPLVAEDPIYPGAEVTVADGAFMGAAGVVFRVLPARQRVQILLDFLGRTTLAEVDRKSLVVENSSLADLMPTLATIPRAPLVGVG